MSTDTLIVVLVAIVAVLVSVGWTYVILYSAREDKFMIG